MILHQGLFVLSSLNLLLCGSEWTDAFNIKALLSIRSMSSLTPTPPVPPPHTNRRQFSSTKRHTKITTNLFWPEHRHSERQDDDEHNGEDGDDEAEEEDARLLQVLDSVLQVHCTHSEPDYLIPWQKQHQSMSTSSGFVIEIPGFGKRVVTNAHSVEYGSIVQVQRRGGEHKYEAKVHVIANECDLALLDVEDEDFWQDLEPLEFGTLPALQQDVEVLGYPTGGDSLSITQGVVSRIEMQEYSQASTHLLAIQIDAAINSGNSGGPVVNEDLKVIGVAFQGLEGAENIGYVVPVTVVQHILQGLQRDGKYTGFCSLGIDTCHLENKGFRKSLGMLEKNLSGIMVKYAVPTSASRGILLPNDVICQVDGISVGNDGKIPFRRGERVSLACYIQTKFVGDIVQIQVWRDGELVQLDVPLGISRRLVPAHFHNESPPYLVVGGLVFTVLSVPYLFASNAWDHYVSDSISYLLGRWHTPVEDESHQVVVMSQVLVHRENLGFDMLADLHLVKMNGQKVLSLAHLKQLLDECQETFVRFEFAPNDDVIILEYSKLEQVTQEVCQQNSIQKPFFLNDEFTTETSLAEATKKDSGHGDNGATDDKNEHEENVQQSGKKVAAGAP